MIVNNCEIEGLKIIEPTVFGDQRGYFYESYNAKVFNEKIIKTKFLQDNESFSSKGTLRGLHYQKPPYAQAKLVRVIQGEVLDVAVDLRSNSKTFGQHYSIVLNEENKKQFFVPRGFAHGFIVLSDTAIFSYKVDNDYAPKYDSGIIYSDPFLGIKWNINESDLRLSDKDIGLKTFEEYKENPDFT